MADDPYPDDDATRIYRPYGSPPPDPAEAPEPADDPFAPATPDPFAPDPGTPDPFAPEPSAADPFAPDVPSPDPFAPEPSAADPFAPTPSPADDPFRAASPATGAAPDPFSPAPSSAPDPFAPDPAPPPPAATPDPFAPASEDPFAPAPSSGTTDPFRSAPVADPFGPSGPDPFAPAPAPTPPPPTPPPAAPPKADPFAPSGPDPFDLSGADPFAPQPTPKGPAVPDRSADPFAATPSTTSDDPFADFQGPTGGGRGAFDSGYHNVSAPGPDVDLPTAFEAERTLAGAFTPVFSLILQIRSSEDLGDPTALRQRIESLLRESARVARQAGARDEDIAQAEFCLVAFLDEAILASQWPGQGAWSAEPLQLTHYDRFDAGEQFFDRLKALLDEGGTRKELLEVYYLCLALGFKGRYAIHGREVLRRLVDDLYTRISAGNEPGKLAPRGTSREVPAEAEKGGIPTWALWVGAAALVALLYLVLSLMLSSAASETADDLRTLSAQSE